MFNLSIPLSMCPCVVVHPMVMVNSSCGVMCRCYKCLNLLTEVQQFEQQF
jgi:hypothetical protein